MGTTLDRRSAEVLRAIRDVGGPATRAEIGASTGRARGPLAEHLEHMVNEGLLREVAPAPSSGGRKAQRLDISESAARIGVIDVGGSRTMVGIADLAGRLIDHRLISIMVDAGPQAVLDRAEEELSSLLEKRGRGKELMLVAGLPGPVDFSTGHVVSPPIMVGWEGFDVADHLNKTFHAPCIIDNDVNLIALAEHHISHPASQVMLVVKLGTGIGGGIVIGGELLRGSRGAAGDIGHTQAVPPSGRLCRCGHLGCVEAEAAGWALTSQLQSEGLSVENVADVARLAREGSPEAVAVVRQSMRSVGSALADAVSLLNPDTVVLVGEMMDAGDQVLAILRESVYQYSHPLATHDLVLAQSSIGQTAGLRGGAILGSAVLLHDFEPQQALAVT